MTEGPLHVKLNPQRFPNMSHQMAAVPGFVLEREYTAPTLTDVQVTPDGHVLAWTAEQDGVGHSMHLGVAMAAGLDQGERAQFAALARSRLGMEPGERAGESRPRVRRHRRRARAHARSWPPLGGSTPACGLSWTACVRCGPRTSRNGRTGAFCQCRGPTRS